jgi:hypothetical protein
VIGVALSEMSEHDRAVAARERQGVTRRPAAQPHRQRSASSTDADPRRMGRKPNSSLTHSEFVASGASLELAPGVERLPWLETDSTPRAPFITEESTDASGKDGAGLYDHPQRLRDGAGSAAIE